MNSTINESNDNDLKASIAGKLFTRPRYHDRFQMLNNQEICYLLQNAGFSQKEKTVFSMRCKGFSLILIAYESSYSLSQIKKISARVNKKISSFLLVKQ